MDTPTAAEVRTWAPPNLNWATYGFPVPDPPSDPDTLQVRVDWSVGELYAVTGRTMASITSVEEVPIAQRVIAAFTITQAMGGGPKALKVLEAPWLKHYRAGSYDEERFSPKDLGADGSQPPYPPALWALLWALMDEDHRDDWMFRLTGVRRPAGTFVEVDFGGDHHHVGPSIWGPGITHPWSW